MNLIYVGSELGVRVDQLTVANDVELTEECNEPQTGPQLATTAQVSRKRKWNAGSHEKNQALETEIKKLATEKLKKSDIEHDTEKLAKDGNETDGEINSFFQVIPELEGKLKGLTENIHAAELAIVRKKMVIAFKLTCGFNKVRFFSVGFLTCDSCS